MSKWTRQPQEVEGDYFFEGTLVCTPGAGSLLGILDVLQIMHELRRAARDNDGLDYLQVYKTAKGEKIWIMDALSRSMKTDGSYSASEACEYDITTILLPEEH